MNTGLHDHVGGVFKTRQSLPDFELRSVAANWWLEAAAAAAAATAAAMNGLLWCCATIDGGETPSRDESGEPDRCLDGLIGGGEKEGNGGIEDPDDGGVGVRDGLPM